MFRLVLHSTVQLHAISTSHLILHSVVQLHTVSTFHLILLVQLHAVSTFHLILLVHFHAVSTFHLILLHSTVQLHAVPTIHLFLLHSVLQFHAYQRPTLVSTQLFLFIQYQRSTFFSSAQASSHLLCAVQACDGSVKHKTEMVSRLEEKTNQLVNALKEMEKR